MAPVAGDLNGLRLGVPEVVRLQHVFRQAQTTLEFVLGGGGAVNVEQRVVTFFVLVDLVSHLAQTPILGIGNLAAIVLDDLFHLLGEVIILTLRQVLPCDEHGFIKWHFIPLRLKVITPGLP